MVRSIRVVGSGVEETAWAACGAMALTGDLDGPPLFVKTDAAHLVNTWLEPFGWDSRILGERAALMGLQRSGKTSAGGSTRLIPTSDGWVAVSLARPSDVELLPALLSVSGLTITTDQEGWATDSTWTELSAALAERSTAELLERSQLLGIPLSSTNETPPLPTRNDDLTSEPADSTAPSFTKRNPVVVDLSALWAGPLAASALGEVGAEVIKVEDVGRPDGARFGSPEFFNLLNASKKSVALDFGSRTGREILARIVDAADIVISSVRARAIDQLGLDPQEFLSAGTDRVWVAVTGHGWTNDRVGFGDDCAVGGGLVAWHPEDGEPRFVGDAIGDPMCGAWAASQALQAWQDGGRHFVDASLAGVASLGAPNPDRLGPDGERALDEPAVHESVHKPVARSSRDVARNLGADNESVLAAIS